MNVRYVNLGTEASVYLFWICLHIFLTLGPQSHYHKEMLPHYGVIWASGLSNATLVELQGYWKETLGCEIYSLHNHHHIYLLWWSNVMYLDKKTVWWWKTKIELLCQNDKMACHCELEKSILYTLLSKVVEQKRSLFCSLIESWDLDTVQWSKREHVANSKTVFVID